ncbi:hypothetical protein I8748_32040 [Nostoc sp. CENA67]|uniref:Uncharacterized protein n=1 Tax=Amazonocrinis nigriterrae CENA67 TaxID=2794033 RepID=A0A8J7HYU7_9NOST|nr:hypothetical protein [Amazonocrinis nigriterrae]MBH8566730.1 hypothetical protein [Amazonocrinis nigriterrae CENA67]
MHYIDTHQERDYSQEELIALCTGNAKPFPSSYYQSEKSLITEKNASHWREYQELEKQEYEEEGGDYSEFSCPLHKWQYLCKKI